MRKPVTLFFPKLGYNSLQNCQSQYTDDVDFTGKHGKKPKISVRIRVIRAFRVQKGFQ